MALTGLVGIGSVSATAHLKVDTQYGTGLSP
jgi:hypothetical protein